MLNGSRKLNYAEQRDEDIKKYSIHIYYSDRYSDEVYEYRHVTLPKQLVKYLPPSGQLMSEQEWRSLGVQQSPGWNHYMVHGPEPHILLFRRERDYELKYKKKL
ncbi:Cyclin-dependent kinases regulatory subunit [Dispira simplex]|nr:Cyclin-dependent kinases regulatory subunit [Dispira simplex]KAJ1659176.1 Cyclin-dependent kinases regulatory subunit [Dispira simplex]